MAVSAAHELGEQSPRSTEDHGDVTKRPHRVAAALRDREQRRDHAKAAADHGPYVEKL
jgi:hypothetical protein